MKYKNIIIIIIFVCFAYFIRLNTKAQELLENKANQDNYWLAKVIAIEETGEIALAEGELVMPWQKVRLKFLNGPQKGKEIIVKHGEQTQLKKSQFVKQRQKVVVLVSQTVEQEMRYYIVDHYRLPAVAIILAIFLALAIFIGRWKGLGSVAGLALSILVLINFTMPRILAGDDPLLISLLTSIIIALLSIYLAHGLNRRTTIAVISTLITLLTAVGLAVIYASLTNLSGLGSEEAFYLQVGVLDSLNTRGLLLGAIIIGSLGVLDDITTAQAATIDELKLANPNFNQAELFRRAMSVGKEHISALVNTLALAYVGASFPLLLLFTANTNQPLWFLLNTELVTEEVIRTLVGSTALILAVPITTFLAAKFLSSKTRF